MSGPIDLTSMLPPDLTEEQKKSWLGRYYPQGLQLQQPQIGTPPPAPEAPQLDMVGQLAQAQAAQNARMGLPPVGGSPLAPPPSPFGALPTAGPSQVPKGGDTPAAWAQYHRDIQNDDARARSANLQNATFAQQPGGMQLTKPQIIPGGRMPAQWHVQEGMQVPWDAKQMLATADQHKRNAIGADLQAGEQDAARQAGYFRQMAKEAQAHQDNMASAERMQADRVGAAVAKLDDLQAAARTRKPDTNPFVLPGGLGSLMGAIGKALGAISSTYTGGPNPAVEVINQNIQQQMAKERALAEKEESSMRGQGTLIGQLRQQGFDRKMAEEGSYLAKLERAKAEMQAMAAKESSPQLRARYESALAGLDQEIGQRNANFGILAQDHVTRTDVNRPAQVVGGGAVSPAGKPLSREQLEKSVHSLSEDLQKADVPGAVAGLRQMDELVNQFGDKDIEGIGPGADFRAGAGKVLTLGMAPGAFLGDREIAVRQKRQAIEDAAIHALSGAAVSAQEMERYMGELRGANDSASFRRALDSIRAAVSEKLRNIQAGAAPEAVEEYKRRGGVLTTDRVSRNKPTAPYVREVGEE